MKKIFVLMMLSAFVIGCNSKKSNSHDEDHMISSSDSIEIENNDSLIRELISTPGYMDLLLESVNKGSADAQLVLGACYYNGWEVPQDYNEAVIWYRKAAEQGHPKAQLNLGNCYELGLGLQQDYDKAIYWYKQSAQQGNADALSSLGECYLKGLGVTCDEKKAVELFQESASQGSSAGMGNLGQAYYWGIGVEKDLKKAISLMETATKQGQQTYYGLLGNAYYQLRDYNKAVYNLQLGAELGDGKAQLLLGDCYLYGIGVEENDSIATMWYNRAAEQGESYSETEIELEELEE